MAVESYFNRTLTLNGIEEPLLLIQKEIGDVSCVVWDAALVLAKYLEVELTRKNWIQGRRAVELGSGVGCVGITAACFGADITVTDLPEVLPLLEKNIELNKKVWSAQEGKINAKPLKWGTADGLKKAEFIFMADCVYYKESIDDLIQTLLLLADKKTEIFLSQEIRDTNNQHMIWSEFMGKLKTNFFVEDIPVSEQHPEFSSPDIHLLYIRKNC